MGRLALPLIALIVASTIPFAGGCASRQKASAQPPAPAALAGPVAAVTPSAGTSAGAGDPPGDPPEVDSAPPAAATSGLVSGSSSSDEDLAGAAILGSNAAPTPTPIPGSLASRTVQAAPGVAKSIVLAPVRFLWASLQSHYAGYAAPEEGTASDGAIAPDENKTANPSATAVPLTQKALDAGEKTYDFSEATVFYPFRLIDDLIGLIFSPF
jgi:hypothetical protein